MNPRMTIVEIRDDLRLVIKFDDGTQGEVAFSEVISRGGVFATLADVEVFRGVEIAGGGRYLVFPGEIDFCADELYEQVQQGVLAAAS